MTLMIFLIALTFSLIAFAMLFPFVVLPRINQALLDRAYPVQIEGWDVRLNAEPSFQTTKTEIAEALEFFADRVVEVKGFDKKDVINKLNSLRIGFISPSNTEGKRYIVDEYGRKIAGDRRGNRIRVVVLEEDNINQTALFHELGHVVHELEGITDYEHNDVQMWKEIVVWCKKNFNR